jgi:hypothetical protein
MEKELIESNQESSESEVSSLEDVRTILKSIYSANPEVSLVDVRETVKDICLQFCDAIELDLQFTGHAGCYWAAAYGNPVEGQRIVAAFTGLGSWDAIARDVGIFTFNFPDKDESTEEW